MFRSDVPYDATPGNLAAIGGIQYSSSSEEDEMSDDGNEKPMDIAEEEEEEQGGQNDYNDDPLGTGTDEIKTVGLLRFPDSNAPIQVNAATGKFRFNSESIPFEMKSTNAMVMKALGSNDEETGKQKAAITLQPCIPLVVHGSPLVLLFSSKDCSSAPGQNGGTAEKSRYMSFTKAAYQLMQLYVVCIDGLIPFPPHFGPNELAHAQKEFSRQMRLMEQEQNKAIDRLFLEAINVGPTGKSQVFAAFITLMENYALQFIHLFEYFLHTCLIQPRCTLPLEAILTPNDKPNLSDCILSERGQILKDTHDFFHYKALMRRTQEEDNAKQGRANTDATPRVLLRPENMLKQVPESDLYRGYIPFQTLYEYFWFLDSDGILTSNKWDL